MKRVYTFLLFFCFASSVFAQIKVSELDSILNVYDRQFRDVLNESDYQLIDEQILEIGQNCRELNTILNSANYSYNYKVALINAFENWTRCPSVILDFIDLVEVEDNNELDLGRLYDLSRFPVFQKIKGTPENIGYFSKYLNESEYLDNCDFFFQEDISYPKLYMISCLLKRDFKPKKKPNYDTCRAANIRILIGLNENQSTKALFEHKR